MRALKFLFWTVFLLLNSVVYLLLAPMPLGCAVYDWIGGDSGTLGECIEREWARWTKVCWHEF